MTLTHGLLSSITLLWRYPRPSRTGIRREVARARPVLESTRLERRGCPSQVTIVGPAFAVAQVSYGSQAPKTAWAQFGGVGTAHLGAPDAQQKANDGTNGLATATFGYGQKPWQVVPGFNLSMDASVGIARTGAYA